MNKEVIKLKVNAAIDLFNIIEEINEHFTIRKQNGIWIAISNSYEITLQKL